MKHDDSVKALQQVVEPHRAVGWFVRHQLWTLGVWKDGQRVALAQGDRKNRGVKRTLTAAVRAWRGR